MKGRKGSVPFMNERVASPLSSPLYLRGAADPGWGDDGALMTEGKKGSVLFLLPFLVPFLGRSFYDALGLAAVAISKKYL